MEVLNETIAGGVGGICLVIVGHPLDTIKVRFQTMQIVPGEPPPYTGVLDCASKIISKEGVTGLYKGMLAPLFGVTPMYSLCFLGYGVGKKDFHERRHLQKPSSERPSRHWTCGRNLRIFYNSYFGAA